MAAMRAYATLAVVVLAMVLSVRPAAAVFDPTLYAGTWTGTWKNLTFKVSNTFTTTVTVPVDGQSMTLNYTIQGLFACGQVGGPRTLVKGTDFTDAGLNFTATNPSFGPATVKSVAKKKFEKVSINGTTTCNTGIKSWRLRAKLTGTTMTGNMVITFAQGKTKKAKDTFTATKQQ